MLDDSSATLLITVAMILKMDIISVSVGMIGIFPFVCILNMTYMLLPFHVWITPGSLGGQTSILDGFL